MSRRRRFQRQAQQQAELRYSPQARGLRALILELQANRDAELSGATAQRRGSVQAIDKARPEVREAYGTERSALDAIGQKIAPVASGLGGAAASILQAGQAEHAAAQGRVADAERRTMVDYSEQRKAARAGEGYAKQAARQRYAADSAKVLQQMVDLGGEQGLYAASTLADLMDRARGRDVTKRGQDLSHQDRQESLDVRRETAKNKPGAANRGRGWATPEAQNKARTTLGEALTEIPTLIDAGFSRSEAAELLAKGAKERRVPVYGDVDDPNRPGKKIHRKLENDDGTPQEKVIPGVAQIKDPLLIQAAIEQHLDGHISKRTQRLLHKNRIKIGPLGLTTAEQYDRKRRKARAGKPPYSPDLHGPL